MSFIRLAVYFMLIFLTGAFPSWAFAQEARCQQLQLVSVYNSVQSTSFQEAVGTFVTWKPYRKDYIVTVAHAVKGADVVFGVCDTKVIELNVVGMDTNRDVALLELPQNHGLSIQSLFNLPQGNLSTAIETSKKKFLNNELNFPTKPSSEPGSFKSFMNRITGRHDLMASPDKAIFSYAGLMADRRFASLTLMHPFFKTDRIETSPVPISGFVWNPLVEKEYGFYRLQNVVVVDQFILNTQFAQDIANPFLDFTPYYLTLGVRPGMSGSPLFEYYDTRLDSKNNLLVGMVSKTKSFKNMSLLIPSEVIETAIQGILTNVKMGSNIMTYNFDTTTGVYRPILVSKTLGLSLANICDSDFKNTSDIENKLTSISNPEAQKELQLKLQKALERLRKEKPQFSTDKNLQDRLKNLKSSKGGDWGDGGGGLLNDTNYLYTPYFTESRYIPEMTCQLSGVVDDKARHIIGYRSGNRILPLRNLDQVVAGLGNAQAPLKSQKDLVLSSQTKEAQTSLCQDLGTKINFRSKVEQITPLPKGYAEKVHELDPTAIPRGIVFRHFGNFQVDNFNCNDQNILSLTLTKDSEFFFTVASRGDYAVMKIRLGSCTIDAQTAPTSPFEFTFNHPLAQVQVAQEGPMKWKVDVGHIAHQCVDFVDKKFNSAIHIEIEGNRL